jgi:hypothetical protein
VGAGAWGVGTYLQDWSNIKAYITPAINETPVRCGPREAKSMRRGFIASYTKDNPSHYPKNMGTYIEIFMSNFEIVSSYPQSARLLFPNTTSP